MKQIRYTLLIFMISCAHKSPSIVDDVHNENISVQSVLDVARTSYLKGCIDSKNHFLKVVKIKDSFSKCVEMSKIHEAEFNELLVKEIKKRDK